MPVARNTMRAFLIAVLLLLVAMPALAQEEPATTSEEQPAREVNEAGKTVYDAVCAACHQPNGQGTNVFPPLYPNPHVEDSAYVEDVIRNGRSGEIVVNGVTYNSVMPAQSLPDADIVAVIDYVQNDLGRLPITPGEVIEEEAFPWGLLTLFTLVAVLAVGIAYIIVTPGEGGFTWARAWWLAAIVFLYFAIGTVWLPDYVINEPTLKEMPDLLKDLAASGAWFVALAVGIYALRFLQKKGRV